jgi:hypothetical protein
MAAEHMTLHTLLLLVAFLHRLRAPDVAAGQARFEAILGRQIEPEDFDFAVHEALAAAEIYDPVRLPPGALQCHWDCELTSVGVATVMALLRTHGASADELIAQASAPPTRDLNSPDGTS